MNVICSFIILLIIHAGNTQDYQFLEQKVTLRLFTPESYNTHVERENKYAVWDMGIDLPCWQREDGEFFGVAPPSNFNPDLPLKLISSGFMVSCLDHCTNYVNAWMDKTNQQANIIVLEWLELSKPIESTLLDVFAGSFDADIYNRAAHSSIDVGRYVGQCLAALWWESDDYYGPHIHLVGASLGAHLVGTAARTFDQMTGQKVARVTGLDPAGPDFIDGPILPRDEWLHRNRLNKNDADFVDVIHTLGSTTPAVLWNPSRFGDLNPMGHADYYPDGGEEQENCGLLKVLCSHKRSAEYYVNSIMDPYLFPSYECNSLDMCTMPQAYHLTGQADSYMGENADYYQTSDSKMYFLKLDRNSAWDYYGHWYSSDIEKAFDSAEKLIEKGTEKVEKLIDRGTEKVEKFIDRGTDTAVRVFDGVKGTVEQAIDNFICWGIFC